MHLQTWSARISNTLTGLLRQVESRTDRRFSTCQDMPRVSCGVCSSAPAFWEDARGVTTCGRSL